MRVRGEKSENKWRRGGGRRPVRGEARRKGGGNRGDDAGWRRGGRTIPCQDLRRPEGEKRVGGPERERQPAQARLGPQRRLLFSGNINDPKKVRKEVPEVGPGRRELGR